MKRFVLLVLLLGGFGSSMAQDPNHDSFLRSRRLQRAERPSFPPSNSVHIAPTQKEVGTAMWTAPGYWIAQGYELGTLIGMLYDFDVTRMDFNDRELARTRYDVAFVPATEVGEAAMKEAIRVALQRELGLLITRDVRRRDVYVVTAPSGPGPELRATSEAGGFTATNSLVTVPKGTAAPTREEMERLLLARLSSEGVSVDSISMTSGTIAQFCSTLEASLDRPVVDESHLQGSYGIELRRENKTREQFFDQIEKELGLVVSSGQRDVTLLTVHPR